MKKIRIKNSIRVSWGITMNGRSVSLSGYNLSIKLIVFKQTFKVSNYTVTGNVITFVFDGASQEKCGSYTLVCQYEDSQGLHTIDSVNAFELVPHTCEEGGLDSSNLALEVVHLSTDIDSSTIGRAATIRVDSVETLEPTESAYAKNTGNINDAALKFGIPRGKDGLSAYEVAKGEGFSGTKAEWLESLRGKLNPVLDNLDKSELGLGSLPASGGSMFYNGKSWEWKNGLDEQSLSDYLTKNNYATKSWVQTYHKNNSSGGDNTGGGGGTTVDLTQYSWWGRKFDKDTNTIVGAMSSVTSIEFLSSKDDTINRKLYLDENGDLCFDGNFYATGGITALGSGGGTSGGTGGGGSTTGTLYFGTSNNNLGFNGSKDMNIAFGDGLSVEKTDSQITVSATGGGSGGSGITIKRNGTTVNATSGSAMSCTSINFAYPSSWTDSPISRTSDNEVKIDLSVVAANASGGSSSGTLNYGFGVKCDGTQIGSSFDGSSGACINLIAGSGITLTPYDYSYGNHTIEISASGSGSSGGSFSGTTTRMLYFYGSGTAGGTTTNMGGFDGSVATYLHFQGSGVTVSQSTSNSVEHVYVNISGGGSTSSSVSWSDVTNKPSTFTPSSHTHSTSDISGLASFVQGTKVTNATNADKATQLATARTIWGQSFNGTDNVSGNMSGVGNIGLTGSINWGQTKTSLSSTSYEIYGASSQKAPYIDFHYYNGSEVDFTARLIADGENTLGFSTNSGTGTFNLNKNKLQIGNGTLEWDSSNSCFKINGSVYATGGITALGVSNGSTTSNNVDFTFNSVTAPKATFDRLYLRKEYNYGLYIGTTCALWGAIETDAIHIGGNFTQTYLTENIVINSSSKQFYSVARLQAANGLSILDGYFDVTYNGTKYKFDFAKAKDLGLLTTTGVQTLSDEVDYTNIIQ